MKKKKMILNFIFAIINKTNRCHFLSTDKPIHLVCTASEDTTINIGAFVCILVYIMQFCLLFIISSCPG